MLFKSSKALDHISPLNCHFLQEFYLKRNNYMGFVQYVFTNIHLKSHFSQENSSVFFYPKSIGAVHAVSMKISPLFMDPTIIRIGYVFDIITAGLLEYPYFLGFNLLM